MLIITGFPTKVYKGKKSILITTRTVMGGRNNFLGIAYIVVGGLCIVLGAIFTATHLIKPRYVQYVFDSRPRTHRLILPQKTRRPHLPVVEQRPCQ